MLKFFQLFKNRTWLCQMVTKAINAIILAIALIDKVLAIVAGSKLSDKVTPNLEYLKTFLLTLESVLTKASVFVCGTQYVAEVKLAAKAAAREVTKEMLDEATDELRKLKD